VYLAAGDDFGWRRLLDMAEGGAVRDWTSFWVLKARREMDEGLPVDAASTLKAVSPLAARECDVLIARRDAAAAAPGGRGLAAAEEALAEAFPDKDEGGRLPISVCIDPRRDEGRFLTVRVESPGPALAWWGWDGGKEATLELPPGESTFPVPLEGLSGKRAFGMGTAVGPPVKLLSARKTGR